MVVHKIGYEMLATTEGKAELDKFSHTLDKGKKCEAWTADPAKFRLPSPGWPTEAPPGTLEKVLVMIAREKRLEPLFHPYDSKIEGDIRPLLFYLAVCEARDLKRGIKKGGV